MANFSFTVDTQEMASTIQEVSPHVNGATAAVVGMQAAVIAAENRAAAKICNHVNRGFFGLIRSQISQKLAAVRSQIEARLLELRDQSTKLRAVQQTMERDFQMITARYTKLFQTLDSALYSRVRELDEPAVDLMHRDGKRIYRRYESLQASLPVNQLESLQSSQLITVSGTKLNASRAINAMNQFIADSSRQNLLTLSILQCGAATDALWSVPFLIIDCDGTTPNSRQWRYYVPSAMPSAMKSRLSQFVPTTVMGGAEQLLWEGERPEQRAAIEKSFQMFVERSALSARAKKKANELLMSSKWVRMNGVRG